MGKREVRTYRQIPVDIQAVEFTDYNAFYICEWADNTYFVPPCYQHSLRRENEKDSSTGHIRDEAWRAPGFLVILTDGGSKRADKGDMIIKDSEGNFDVKAAADFKLLYEEVVD